MNVYYRCSTAANFPTLPAKSNRFFTRKPPPSKDVEKYAYRIEYVAGAKSV